MSDLFNRKSVAEAVAEAHNLTKKEANEIVELVFETIKNELKHGGKVDIAGFGKFEVRTRNARIGINPATKARIDVPASKIPGFKASKLLKELVK